MIRIKFGPFVLALCAALATPAAAQSVKVIDPSTGLAVFSSANPARVSDTDATTSGSITGNAQSVTLSLAGGGFSSGSLQLTGTWVGTVQFEGTVDGTTYLPINGVFTATSAPTSTTTTNGIIRLTPGSLTGIRVTSTAWTSGTAVVSFRASSGAGGTFINQTPFVIEVADSSSASGTALNASAAAASAVVGKASAGNLYGANITSGASAGFVMVFNAASAPADGAVTPARCIPLAANTGIELNYRAVPSFYTTGITVVFSTTGCFTKTASATAFIAVDAK